MNKYIYIRENPRKNVSWFASWHHCRNEQKVDSSDHTNAQLIFYLDYYSLSVIGLKLKGEMVFLSPQKQKLIHQRPFRMKLKLR